MVCPTGGIGTAVAGGAVVGGAEADAEVVGDAAAPDRPSGRVLR
jgi:hypothetical protein